MVLAPFVIFVKSQYSLWSCAILMVEGICISKLMLPRSYKSKREEEAFFCSTLYDQHTDYFFDCCRPFSLLQQTDFSPKMGTFESCWGRANSHPWKGPSMEKKTTGCALGSSVDSSRVQNVSFGLLISSLTHLSSQSLKCTWGLVSAWNTQ